MRQPTKVLTTLAGGAVDDLVADRLTELRSDRLEVLLHPSDLVVNGGEETTDLVILDAADFGAVASVRIPHRVPPGFHGNWVANAA